jgi:rhodanese-related sulfurtransferase
MSQLAELTPTEVRSRWPDLSTEVVLLDVREPEEIRLANVAGTLDIPMREIPARLGELATDKPIVVMCHSGVRSRRVAEYLSASGFSQIFNLAGGIDAWSRELDPSVPRY